MSFPMPTRDDFTSPDETIVHHHADVRADDRGRFQFVAYWLTDQEWVPDGIRAQVFNTSLANFIARSTGPVRVVKL